MMRIVALSILAITAVSAAAPALAQTYDPDYPVCMRIYGPLSYNQCSFTSLPQCRERASGRAAQCILNPFFTNAHRELPRRGYRRHHRRRAY